MNQQLGFLNNYILPERNNELFCYFRKINK